MAVKHCWLFALRRVAHEICWHLMARPQHSRIKHRRASRLIISASVTRDDVSAWNGKKMRENRNIRRGNRRAPRFCLTFESCLRNYRRFSGTRNEVFLCAMCVAPILKHNTRTRLTFLSLTHGRNASFNEDGWSRGWASGMTIGVSRKCDSSMVPVSRCQNFLIHPTNHHITLNSWMDVVN